MSDMPDEIRQMSAYIAQLKDTLAATKKPSDGTDRRGAVRLVIGEDGLPSSIQVASDWQQRLMPSDLGAAVMEAVQAAAQRSFDAWIEQTGGPDGTIEADRFLGASSTAADVPAPPALATGLDQVVPRPLGELAEAFIETMDRVSEIPSAPLQGRGTAAGGAVVVVVTRSGLVECEVSDRWAGRQSTGALARALNSAVAAAKEALSAVRQSAEEAGAVPGAGADALLREALALLADPERLRSER